MAIQQQLARRLCSLPWIASGFVAGPAPRSTFGTQGESYLGGAGPGIPSLAVTVWRVRSMQFKLELKRRRKR